jgi:hypothetical protein
VCAIIVETKPIQEVSSHTYLWGLLGIVSVQQYSMFVEDWMSISPAVFNVCGGLDEYMRCLGATLGSSYY